ncbi:taste receptor type 2 member 40-like [Gastrophryne carolinensis]
MSPATISMIFFGLLEASLCFCLNAYIMVAHLMGLRHGPRLSPCELIQLIMGATNLSGQVFAVLQSSVLWLPVPAAHLEKIFLSAVIMVPAHVYFSYWLVAWLCSYYCGSVASSGHRAVAWIRRSLVSSMPHLIGLSAFGSFTMNLHSVWNCRIQISLENCTRCPHIDVSYTHPRLTFITSSGFILPFFISVVSLVVSVSSLANHIRSTGQDNAAVTRSKIQAHVSAVRTMVLLLLLCIAVCVAGVMNFSQWTYLSPNMYAVLPWIILLAPSAEAAIIIQSSPKLRRMCPWGTCARRNHT